MSAATAYVMNHAARLLSEKQGGVLSGVPVMHEALSRFFVQATIILAICRVLSLIGSYLGQPRVIFEIIGGILLGPSAIGRDEKYLEDIFPKASLSYLSIVANIGLTFYLFLVGLELDPKLLATHARKAGGIAVIGMAVPFALGVGVSRVMFDVLQGNDPAYKDVSFVSFFVFIGTAMSITAFPVLARILKEGGLIYTKAGAMTMGAAALNDAIAWCLLTLAISIANAGNLAVAGYVFLTVAAFALGLIVIIRPIFEYVVEYVEKMHNPTMNNNLFAFTICIMFMCAWTTALLGVHAIFGAFLFGLIVPRGSHLFKECNERIEEFVVTVTLPLYFALSGLKTDVTTIHTAAEGEITILVCVVATFGKFIGAGGTAYLAGMTPRESSVVAVLMNTRGLIELIVLNLGMESGILSTRTFSVMVVMCLVTTFLTCPLVEFIYPKSMRIRVVDGVEVEASPDSKKKKKLPDGVTQDVNRADSESDGLVPAVAETILDFSIHAHIGVMVDKLTQIQGILKLMVYFLPNELNSELGVTAVHTIEPTNSTKDEFLPLNDDGKLIRVDEETTDFAAALHDMEDPAAKKPELLPLSMFCRAVNSSVNAFRVQGDPNEFPVVLKNIYKANDCSMLVMPWRPGSAYAEQLFWSTVQVSPVPVALFASIEQHLQFEHNHPHQHQHHGSASSATSNGHHGTVAEADHTSSRDRSGSGGGGTSTEQTPAVRQRGNSVFAKPAMGVMGDYGNVEDDEGDEEDGNRTLYSTVPSRIVAQHRRSTITNQMKKVGTKRKTTSTVLAILTGRHMDITVFSVLLRSAENPLNEIFVMVPRDYDTFASCSEGLHFFKHQTARKAHVTVYHLSAITSDTDELVRESLSTLSSVASHGHFDLLVTAFIEPASGSSVAPEPMPQVRAHRSGTISDALVGTFMTISGNDGHSADFAGPTPAKYAHSGLAYPELGVLGNAVLFHSENEDGTHPQYAKSSLMLLLHESERLLSRGAFIDSQSTQVQPQSTVPFQPVAETDATELQEVGIEMKAMEVAAVVPAESE